MKKSFRLLAVSQLTANLGDVFYIVGLIAILYSVMTSPFYMVLLPVLSVAGRMMSSSLSPLLFYRYRLKHILIVSQMFKTLLLCVFIVIAPETLSIFTICLIIFSISFMDGVAQPASAALIPRIVEKEKLMRANSILSIINETTLLSGWVLGGTLVALTSGTHVIFLTFILFVVSTLCMFFIIDRTPFEPIHDASKQQQLTAGFRTIWHDRSFRAIHVVILFEAVANVVWIAAIMYLFVANVLHVSEAWWGYLNATFFAGLLLGGFLCTKFEQSLYTNMHRALVVASIAAASIMLLFSMNHLAMMALLLSMLYGICDQMKGIVMNTWLQQKATHDELVRIYSAQSVLTSFLFGISTFTAGILMNSVSVQWIFIGASILLAIATLYIICARRYFQQ